MNKIHDWEIKPSGRSMTIYGLMRNQFGEMRPVKVVGMKSVKREPASPFGDASLIIATDDNGEQFELL